MKEFVEYLVKNLVDQPDSVNISCLEGEKGMLIEIRVAREDIPKVIGRQGKTIKALRTLVLVAAARLGRHARLEIIE
jgi:predicted RNA-binding protein YlqC (UPF0109 family)